MAWNQLGIKNSLHWILWVATGEDPNRIRQNIATENMAALPRIDINLTK